MCHSVNWQRLRRLAGRCRFLLLVPYFAYFTITCISQLSQFSAQLLLLRPLDWHCGIGYRSNLGKKKAKKLVGWHEKNIFIFGRRWILALNIMFFLTLSFFYVLHSGDVASVCQQTQWRRWLSLLLSTSLAALLNSWASLQSTCTWLRKLLKLYSYYSQGCYFWSVTLGHNHVKVLSQQ